MSPPDPLCHWAVRTQQQQLCLSRGDPKLPCTHHPSHPGLRGGTGNQGLPGVQHIRHAPACTLQRGRLPPPQEWASGSLPSQARICLSFQMLWPPSGTSNRPGNICCAALQAYLTHTFCNDIIAYCMSFRLFIFVLSYAHKPEYDTPCQLDD